MKFTLFLIPFLIMTLDAGETDLDPIIRQDGYRIPGFDNICHILESDCVAKSTNCMTARCNAAMQDSCYGEPKEYNSPCEDELYDVDHNLVTVPGVCVEGVCVHVPDSIQCPDGTIVAYRTFPSCGTLSFGTTFRFITTESFVTIGDTEESFGPNLEKVQSATSQRTNDPSFGIAKVRYLDMTYGDCIVGHDPSCIISEEGTYNLMGMTIKWQPNRNDANHRNSSLQIGRQTIELKPQFYCDTHSCRTSIQVKGTSPSPCGETQIVCQDACKYSVSGFTVYPENNGDYAERNDLINGFPAYAMINGGTNFAKGTRDNQWWWDNDMTDYEKAGEPTIQAYMKFAGGQDPFDSEGIFEAHEYLKPGDESSVIDGQINIRKTCKSNDPGPCGSVTGLYSTHKYWSVAYGNVRFHPADISEAYVAEKPNDPYNIALLGDVDITSQKVEFTVEVTFTGQMAGILVFGSENSYVMCRLDSSIGKPGPATGLSIVEYPNDLVANGAEDFGQPSNLENTLQRLKITVHENTITCYLSGVAESSQEVARTTGTYTGTHTGRVGFLTYKAAASFRILGCPIQGNDPIDPPVPPCVPTTTQKPTTPSSSSDSKESRDDSKDSEDDSKDSKDDSKDSKDDSKDSKDDSNDGDSGDGNSRGRLHSRDSNSAEVEVGDSESSDRESDSKDSESKDDSKDSSDSKDGKKPKPPTPDDGPSCKDIHIDPSVSDSNSDSKDSDSKDDSFDVELAIGVQTQSLSHAVFEDRIIYLLASVGLASSLLMLYRFVCTKEDYEVISEPEMEEI